MNSENKIYGFSPFYHPGFFFWFNQHIKKSAAVFTVVVFAMQCWLPHAYGAVAAAREGNCGTKQSLEMFLVGAAGATSGLQGVAEAADFKKAIWNAAAAIATDVIGYCLYEFTNPSWFNSSAISWDGKIGNWDTGARIDISAGQLVTMAAGAVISAVCAWGSQATSSDSERDTNGDGAYNSQDAGYDQIWDKTGGNAASYIAISAVSSFSGALGTELTRQTVREIAISKGASEETADLLADTISSVAGVLVKEGVTRGLIAGVNFVKNGADKKSVSKAADAPATIDDGKRTREVPAKNISNVKGKLLDDTFAAKKSNKKKSGISSENSENEDDASPAKKSSNKARAGSSAVSGASPPDGKNQPAAPKKSIFARVGDRIRSEFKQLYNRDAWFTKEAWADRGRSLLQSLGIHIKALGESKSTKPVDNSWWGAIKSSLYSALGKYITYKWLRARTDMTAAQIANAMTVCAVVEGVTDALRNKDTQGREDRTFQDRLKTAITQALSKVLKFIGYKSICGMSYARSVMLIQVEEVARAVTTGVMRYAKAVVQSVKSAIAEIKDKAKVNRAGGIKKVLDAAVTIDDLGNGTSVVTHKNGDVFRIPTKAIKKQMAAGIDMIFGCQEVTKNSDGSYTVVLANGESKVFAASDLGAMALINGNNGLPRYMKVGALLAQLAEKQSAISSNGVLYKNISFANIQNVSTNDDGNFVIRYANGDRIVVSGEQLRVLVEVTDKEGASCQALGVVLEQMARGMAKPQDVRISEMVLRGVRDVSRSQDGSVYTITFIDGTKRDIASSDAGSVGITDIDGTSRGAAGGEGGSVGITEGSAATDGSMPINVVCDKLRTGALEIGDDGVVRERRVDASGDEVLTVVGRFQAEAIEAKTISFANIKNVTFDASDSHYTITYTDGSTLDVAAEQLDMPVRVAEREGITSRSLGDVLGTLARGIGVNDIKISNTSLQGLRGISVSEGGVYTLLFADGNTQDVSNDAADALVAIIDADGNVVHTASVRTLHEDVRTGALVIGGDGVVYQRRQDISGDEALVVLGRFQAMFAEGNFAGASDSAGNIAAHDMSIFYGGARVRKNEQGAYEVTAANGEVYEISDEKLSKIIGIENNSGKISSLTLEELLDKLESGQARFNADGVLSLDGQAAGKVASASRLQNMYVVDNKLVRIVDDSDLVQSVPVLFEGEDKTRTYNFDIFKKKDVRQKYLSGDEMGKIEVDGRRVKIDEHTLNKKVLLNIDGTVVRMTLGEYIKLRTNSAEFGVGVDINGNQYQGKADPAGSGDIVLDNGKHCRVERPLQAGVINPYLVSQLESYAAAGELPVLMVNTETKEQVIAPIGALRPMGAGLHFSIEGTDGVYRRAFKGELKRLSKSKTGVFSQEGMTRISVGNEVMWLTRTERGKLKETGLMHVIAESGKEMVVTDGKGGMRVNGQAPDEVKSGQTRYGIKPVGKNGGQMSRVDRFTVTVSLGKARLSKEQVEQILEGAQNITVSDADGKEHVLTGVSIDEDGVVFAKDGVTVLGSIDSDTDAVDIHIPGIAQMSLEQFTTLEQDKSAGIVLDGASYEIKKIDDETYAVTSADASGKPLVKHVVIGMVSGDGETPLGSWQGDGTGSWEFVDTKTLEYNSALVHNVTTSSYLGNTIFMSNTGIPLNARQRHALEQITAQGKKLVITANGRGISLNDLLNKRMRVRIERGELGGAEKGETIEITGSDLAADGARMVSVEGKTCIQLADNTLVSLVGESGEFTKAFTNTVLQQVSQYKGALKAWSGVDVPRAVDGTPLQNVSFGRFIIETLRAKGPKFWIAFAAELTIRIVLDATGKTKRYIEGDSALNQNAAVTQSMWIKFAANLLGEAIGSLPKVAAGFAGGGHTSKEYYDRSTGKSISASEWETIQYLEGDDTPKGKHAKAPVLDADDIKKLKKMQKGAYAQKAQGAKKWLDSQLQLEASTNTDRPVLVLDNDVRVMIGKDGDVRVMEEQPTYLSPWGGTSGDVRSYLGNLTRVAFTSAGKNFVAQFINHQFATNDRLKMYAQSPVTRALLTEAFCATASAAINVFGGVIPGTGIQVGRSDGNLEGYFRYKEYFVNDDGKFKRKLRKDGGENISAEQFELTYGSKKDVKKDAAENKEDVAQDASWEQSVSLDINGKEYVQVSRKLGSGEQETKTFNRVVSARKSAAKNPYAVPFSERLARLPETVIDDINNDIQIAVNSASLDRLLFHEDIQNSGLGASQAHFERTLDFMKYLHTISAPLTNGAGDFISTYKALEIANTQAGRFAGALTTQATSRLGNALGYSIANTFLPQPMQSYAGFKPTTVVLRQERITKEQDMARAYSLQVQVVCAGETNMSSRLAKLKAIKNKIEKEYGENGSSASTKDIQDTVQNILGAIDNQMVGAITARDFEGTFSAGDANSVLQMLAEGGYLDSNGCLSEKFKNLGKSSGLAVGEKFKKSQGAIYDILQQRIQQGALLDEFMDVKTQARQQPGASLESARIDTNIADLLQGRASAPLNTAALEAAASEILAGASETPEHVSMTPQEMTEYVLNENSRNIGRLQRQADKLRIAEAFAALTAPIPFIGMLTRTSAFVNTSELPEPQNEEQKPSFLQKAIRSGTVEYTANRFSKVNQKMSETMKTFFNELIDDAQKSGPKRGRMSDSGAEMARYFLQNAGEVSFSGEYHATIAGITQPSETYSSQKVIDISKVGFVDVLMKALRRDINEGFMWAPSAERVQKAFDALGPETFKKVLGLRRIELLDRHLRSYEANNEHIQGTAEYADVIAYYENQIQQVRDETGIAVTSGGVEGQSEALIADKTEHAQKGSAASQAQSTASLSSSVNETMEAIAGIMNLRKEKPYYAKITYLPHIQGAGDMYGNTAGDTDQHRQEASALVSEIDAGVQGFTPAVLTSRTYVDRFGRPTLTQYYGNTYNALTKSSAVSKLPKITQYFYGPFGLAMTQTTDYTQVKVSLQDAGPGSMVDTGIRTSVDYTKTGLAAPGSVSSSGAPRIKQTEKYFAQARQNTKDREESAAGEILEKPSTDSQAQGGYSPVRKFQFDPTAIQGDPTRPALTLDLELDDGHSTKEAGEPVIAYQRTTSNLRPNISYNVNAYTTGPGQTPYAGPAYKTEISTTESGVNLQAQRHYSLPRSGNLARSSFSERALDWLQAGTDEEKITKKLQSAGWSDEQISKTLSVFRDGKGLKQEDLKAFFQEKILAPRQKAERRASIAAAIVGEMKNVCVAGGTGVSKEFKDKLAARYGTPDAQEMVNTAAQEVEHAVQNEMPGFSNAEELGATAQSMNKEAEAAKKSRQQAESDYAQKPKAIQLQWLDSKIFPASANLEAFGFSAVQEFLRGRDSRVHLDVAQALIRNNTLNPAVLNKIAQEKGCTSEQVQAAYEKARGQAPEELATLAVAAESAAAADIAIELFDKGSVSDETIKKTAVKYNISAKELTADGRIGKNAQETVDTVVLRMRIQKDITSAMADNYGTPMSESRINELGLRKKYGVPVPEAQGLDNTDVVTDVMNEINSMVDRKAKGFESADALRQSASNFAQEARNEVEKRFEAGDAMDQAEIALQWSLSGALAENASKSTLTQKDAQTIAAAHNVTSKQVTAMQEQLQAVISADVPLSAVAGELGNDPALRRYDVARKVAQGTASLQEVKSVYDARQLGPKAKPEDIIQKARIEMAPRFNQIKAGVNFMYALGEEDIKLEKEMSSDLGQAVEVRVLRMQSTGGNQLQAVPISGFSAGYTQDGSVRFSKFENYVDNGAQAVIMINNDRSAAAAQGNTALADMLGKIKHGHAGVTNAISRSSDAPTIDVLYRYHTTVYCNGLKPGEKTGLGSTPIMPK